MTIIIHSRHTSRPIDGVDSSEASQSGIIWICQKNKAVWWCLSKTSADSSEISKRGKICQKDNAVWCLWHILIKMAGWGIAGVFPSHDWLPYIVMCQYSTMMTMVTMMIMMTMMTVMHVWLAYIVMCQYSTISFHHQAQYFQGHLPPLMGMIISCKLCSNFT